MPQQQHGGMTLQASPPPGRLAGPTALARRPQPQPGAIEAPRLEVRWARHADELRQAQRLRHQVFVGEMGAQLQCPAGTPPGQDPDAGIALPADTVWMNGHDGQAIAIVPSRELAVVRLGLTPSKLQHRPQRLVQALLRTLP